jgi:uncharacterized SAM-binding protein YcdF (DUF218 family)
MPGRDGPGPSARTDRRGPWSWLRFGLLCLLGAATALGTVLVMWPRDDVPRDPDAVAVLGGAGRERAELGIELAERYDAELVLSSSAANFGEKRGQDCGEEAICIEPNPETTTGEARDIAGLADDRGWGHLTVATTDFHTTRSRVLFRQCLGERVTVVGASGGEGRRQVLEELPREALGSLAALTIRRAC